QPRHGDRSSAVHEVADGGGAVREGRVRGRDRRAQVRDQHAHPRPQGRRRHGHHRAAVVQDRPLTAAVVAVHDRVVERTVGAFDAYGRLFDVAAPVRQGLEALGDRGPALAQLWRRTQLEYSWLRTLMGRYVDFWQVTTDALDHALEREGIPPDGVRD